ncbi:MAG: Ig-like domain-containing protein [Granulosicoccus sp.]
MQSKIRPERSWLAAPAVVLLIAGCSSDTNYDFEASKEQAAADVTSRTNPQALFNPGDSVVPFPNNLFFIDSNDGTLNIPIAADADQTLANPQVALNQQDGFSTISPIVTPVSEPLDPASLVIGDTVHMFEVTTLQLPVDGTTPEQRAGARSVVTGVVTDSIAELADATRLNVAEVGNQLVISPLQPLKPSTSYMVVLTNGIMDTQGNAMERSLLYGILQGDTPLGNSDLEALVTPEALATLATPEAIEALGTIEALQAAGTPEALQAVAILEALGTLESLEGLRGMVGSHSGVLSNQLDIDPANVVLTWVFTTQSVREVLQAVKDISNPTSLTLAATGVTTSQADSRLQGKADIYIGALDLPYYQTVVGTDGNPLPALNGFWKNAADNVPGATDNSGKPDYTPLKTEDVKVPVVMTVPNADSLGGGAMPDSGWPVTIFQHGITGNRSLMLAIADAMADAGRAVIAIDMPMHGLTDATNLLHASSNPFGPDERTFDIDVLTVDPDTGEQTQGPDGVADPSGAHFYNLQNLANSRDNLRQATADLFVLTANIGSANVDGISLDASNLTFVGHSLGAIVGTTMLSYENSFQAATIGMGGGGISRLLANSERFGPVINGGLASVGIETGSVAYNQFLTAAQTMIDSGDPINHAATLAAEGNTRIHFIEVIGDAVIPNSVATAPLSGTEPLVRQLGLPSVDTTVVDSGAIVRFTEGDHGSLLSPEASLAATVEMQTQMAGFAASRGSALPVDNTNNVIQAVEN